MKKNLILVMITILAACLMSSCGGGGGGAETDGIEAYSNPGQTISVRVNQEFIIAVDSNPTTGYEWEESYDDESMFELVERIYKAGEQTGTGVKIGAGGVDYFRFKALKSGDSKITLAYKRPWEIVINRQMVFSIDVE